MDYINLEAFLKSKKNPKDISDFLKYVSIVGENAVCEEAWDISSFNMMRKTTPDFTIGAVSSWSQVFDFGDSYFEYTTFKPTVGKDYNSFWYRIGFANYLNGDGEFVDFPDGQKAWCMEKFKSFLNEFCKRGA